MTWEPLRHPDELEKLEPTQLAERLRPLLRRAGLATPEAWPRHVENLALAAVELARDWEKNPTLDGRRVGFDEYLAARLGRRIRDLDRAQHPELYDSDKHYLPANAQEPTEPAVIAIKADVAAEDAREDPATLTPEEHLSADMTRAGIAAASQPAVLAYVAGVFDQEIVNGRQAARALGRGGAASIPLVEAMEYADDLRAEGKTFKH